MLIQHFRVITDAQLKDALVSLRNVTWLWPMISHVIIISFTHYLRLNISVHSLVISNILAIHSTWIVRWYLLLDLLKLMLIFGPGWSNRVSASVGTLRSDPFTKRLLIVVKFNVLVILGPLSLVNIICVPVWIHLLNVFSFMSHSFWLLMEISHSLLVTIPSSQWLKHVVGLIWVL